MSTSFPNYLIESKKRIKESLNNKMTTNYFVKSSLISDLSIEQGIENDFSVCYIDFNSFFRESVNINDISQSKILFSVLIHEIISLLDHHNGTLVENSVDGLTIVFGTDNNPEVNPVLNSVKFALKLFIIYDENIISSLKEKKFNIIDQLELKIGIAYGKVQLEKFALNNSFYSFCYGNTSNFARKLASIANPKELVIGGNLGETLTNDKSMYVSITTPDGPDWPKISTLIKYNSSAKERIVEFIKKI